MRHELSGKGLILRFDMRGTAKKSRVAIGRLLRMPSGEPAIVGSVNTAGNFRWRAMASEELVYVPAHSIVVDVPDNDVRSRVFYCEGFEPEAPPMVCILENGHVTQRLAGPLDLQDCWP